MADVTAAVIRAALRARFPKDAFALLEEVRSGTGYSRQARYADALVCSCWPSRGLWIAGVEIKVSRSDWQRELREPAKSSDIQGWCDYWWIAAPAGVVRAGELPVTWGLLEYDASARAKSKLAVKVAAPKLAPEALTASFVASVMRSCASVQRDAVSRAVNAAVAQTRSECDGARVAALEARLQTAERKASHSVRDAEKLLAAESELRELRALIGLHFGEGVARAPELLRAAAAFGRLDTDRVALALREAAAKLDRIKEEMT